MLEIAFLEDLLSKIISLVISDKSDIFRSIAFKENIKILYTYLQKNKLDLCFSSLITLEDTSLTILKLSVKLFDTLLYGIETRQISPDILLVSASSLILLLEIISPLPEICFLYLLKCDLQKISIDSFFPLVEAFSFISRFNEKQNFLSSVKVFPTCSIFADEDSIVPISNSTYSYKIFYNFSKIEPTFNTYILLHGILNTKPLWLLSMLYDKEDNMESINSLEGSCNNLLFTVWPLISKLCLTSCFHSYQSLQVLLLWIKISKMYLIDLKSSNHFVNEVEYFMVKSNIENRCLKSEKQEQGEFNADETFHKEPCILCQKSFLTKWFSLELSSPGAVFALLNLNWENRSKGASTVIQQCFVEILSLHELFSPGHSTASIRKIVKSVINSRMWYTKGTYLQLQLALKYIGIIEILETYPEIPSNMSKCLKSNDLLPSVTNLYQYMICQLKKKSWLKFFACEHSTIANCCDKSLQHNYFTMWLPLTITHYPDLLSQLLYSCGNSLSGWKTKLVILKIAKAKNLVTLDGQMSHSKGNQLNNSGSPEYLLSQSEIVEIICASLTCGDEMIRADAFNFLCVSKKTLEQFIEIEIKLIMLFFKENLNIDSANFCQSFIKSFIVLIHRLRDAANAEIKKIFHHHFMSTKERNISTLLEGDCKEAESGVELIPKIEDVKRPNNLNVLIDAMAIYINNIASSQLNLLIDCLSFFIYTLNENLSICGNYNRIYTSLKLYFEMLTAFCNLEMGVVIPEFTYIVQFINHVTENGFTNKVIPSPNYVSQITNLMIPSTLNSLITLITHEMNDVKELVAKILTFIIKMNVGIPTTTSNMCLKEAFKMIDSPKFSIAESGAILIKIFCESDKNFGTLSVSTNLENLVSPYEYDVKNLVNYLIEKVQQEFKISQENILYCSVNSPINGSIMALTMCLSDVDDNELDEAFVTNKIVILTGLFQDIIEHTLECLASKSAAGSIISPSFAEMGEAINDMIKECQEKEINDVSGSLHLSCHLQAKTECNFNEGALSDDHQLVLSFCWQLLKVCCWSCGKLTSNWIHVISLETQELMISGIVIRILTGTRHKGAMEAAYSALQEISLTIYKAQLSAKEKILERQLHKMIKSLKDLSETSVTRRSAGLSMIFTAICQAIPSRRVSNVTVDIMKQLLVISQIQVEDEVAHKDVSPALCLHILHSMISNASLTSTTLPLLADICISCLKIFNSKSWAVRNAALQLYGAVVSRLIGQKKVKDDCSSLNSVTASEFFSRHTQLGSIIIDKLKQFVINDDDKRSLSERYLSNVILDNTICISAKVCEMKDSQENHNQQKWLNDRRILNSSTLSSLQQEQTFEKLDLSLVPLLSLLSRLNPGTETQQNDHVKNVISDLIERVSYFLSYPIFTVRRLAASALCSLTSTNDADNLINEITLKALSSIWANTNLVNGCLITLKLLLQNHENKLLENSNLQHLLNVIISDHYPVYWNKSLALNLASVLDLEIDLDLNLPLPTFSHLPGYSDFIKQIVSRKKNITKLNADIIFNLLISRDYEISDEVLNNVKLNSDNIDEEILFRLQGKCWNYITSTNSNFELSLMLRSLAVILELVRLDTEKCIPSCPLLIQILNNKNGTIILRNCLIIVSYFVKHYECFEVGHKLTVSNLINVWTKIIETFANPKSTEDNRSSAAEALDKSILFIYNNKNINRIAIFKALLDLVQDENTSIRAKAAQIICLMTKSYKVKIISNDLSLKNNQLDLESHKQNSNFASNFTNKSEVGVQHAEDGKTHEDIRSSILKNVIVHHGSPEQDNINLNRSTESFYDLFMNTEYGIKCFYDITIQPNVAVKLFVKYIIIEALSQEDKGLIELLCNSFTFKCDKAISNINSNTTKLFSSYSENMYMEQHVICQLLMNVLETETGLPKYSYTEDFQLFCKNYGQYKEIKSKKQHNSENEFVDLCINRRKLEESKITDLYHKFVKLLGKITSS